MMTIAVGCRISRPGAVPEHDDRRERGDDRRGARQRSAQPFARARAARARHRTACPRRARGAGSDRSAAGRCATAMPSTARNPTIEPRRDHAARRWPPPAPRRRGPRAARGTRSAPAASCRSRPAAAGRCRSWPRAVMPSMRSLRPPRARRTRPGASGCARAGTAIFSSASSTSSATEPRSRPATLATTSTYGAMRLVPDHRRRRHDADVGDIAQAHVVCGPTCRPTDRWRLVRLWRASGAPQTTTSLIFCSSNRKPTVEPGEHRRRDAPHVARLDVGAARGVEVHLHLAPAAPRPALRRAGRRCRGCSTAPAALPRPSRAALRASGRRCARRSALLAPVSTSLTLSRR